MSNLSYSKELMLVLEPTRYWKPPAEGINWIRLGCGFTNILCDTRFTCLCQPCCFYLNFIFVTASKFSQATTLVLLWLIYKFKPWSDKWNVTWNKKKYIYIFRFWIWHLLVKWCVVNQGTWELCYQIHVIQYILHTSTVNLLWLGFCMLYCSPCFADNMGGSIVALLSLIFW